MVCSNVHVSVFVVEGSNVYTVFKLSLQFPLNNCKSSVHNLMPYVSVISVPCRLLRCKHCFTTSCHLFGGKAVLQHYNSVFHCRIVLSALITWSSWRCVTRQSDVIHGPSAAIGLTINADALIVGMLFCCSLGFFAACKLIQKVAWLSHPCNLVGLCLLQYCCKVFFKDYGRRLTKISLRTYSI